MNYRRRYVAIVLLVVFSSGCGLGRPRWHWPGSIPSQQARAAYHDPYLDNDAGPAAVGARPRDFAQPRAEPVRARVFQQSPPAYLGH